MFEEEKIAGPATSESAAVLLGLDLPALTGEQAWEVVLACERLVRAAQAVQAEAVVAAVGPAPEPDPDTGREPLDDAAEWLAVDLGGSRQFQLSRIDTARYLRRWLPRTCAAMRAGDWGTYEAGLMVRAAQSLTRPELIGKLEDRIVPRGTFDLARRLRRAVARLDPDAVEHNKRKARSERSLRFFKDRYGDGSAGLAGTAPSYLMALVAAAIDLDARPRLDGDCRTIEMRRFDVLADWARQRLGLPTENHHPDQPTPLHPDTAAAAARALLDYAETHATAARAEPPEPAGSSPDTVPAGDRAVDVAPADGHPDNPGMNGPQPPEVAATDSHPDAPTPGSAAFAVKAGVTPVGSSLLHRDKRCNTCGRTGPPLIPISVTLSLETMLGLSAEAADLAGWGLLDPDTARELAADGQLRRWLCEPATGALLDVGATTYRPRDKLARFIRARDRTCRWPNCHQPAIRCDLDHTEPFDAGGLTIRANLCTLCRRHHRIKHETDASYQQKPDGTTTWKDPSGRTHTRPAERHRHEVDWTDWHADPPPDPDPDPAAAEPEVELECPF